MNLDKKKQVRTQEFNDNRSKINVLQKQLNVFQTRQIQIQGQLLMIEEFENEQKEEKLKVKKVSK